MHTPRRAFTLVELLVVISIIGLLSTIAIVSMSGSRDKARIASAISFERSLHDSLGSSLVAQYDFEEGSGSSAGDFSGNGNTGTLVGSPYWSTDTPYAGSKYSLGFGGGNYVDTARGLGLGSTNFTISAWIKTTSAAGQMYFAATNSSDWFRFGVSVGNVAFLLGNGSFTESDCGTRPVNDGKWHHLAGSFSRTDLTVTCYIDGQQSGKVALGGSYVIGSTSIVRFGSTYCCSTFVGQLDNIRFYTQDTKGVSYTVPLNESGVAAVADRPRPVLIKYE